MRVTDIIWWTDRATARSQPGPAGRLRDHSPGLPIAWRAENKTTA